MQIIVAPRQSGKTTELIKKCVEYKYALIVCNTRQMCEWTFHHAKRLGYSIPMPITYEELQRGTYRGKNIDALLLDNAELFLQTLTSVPIAAIAMSSE